MGNANNENTQWKDENFRNHKANTLPYQIISNLSTQ